MLKYRLLFLTAFLIVSQLLRAQCPPGQTPIRLEINPDQYWYEVSWRITDLNDTQTFASGACAGDVDHVFNYCVPDNQCLVFRIFDSYGDGMAPDGVYRLYRNDTLFHENIGGNYLLGETVTWACPPGAYCNNPLPIGLGQHLTPADAETWYRFMPADTGAYQLSTCNLGNACAAKIWVYDRCAGITVTNNNLGTLFYADGGCDTDSLGASATLYLGGGLEYYFRLGYVAGSCNGQPIAFSLTYEGPIVGCTDPLACNYQPLATVPDTCIYPSDPNCSDLPDLVVLEAPLKSSLTLDQLFNADPCTVEEGCLRGYGNRLIVRFTTHIQNTGVADYFIGETPPDPNQASDQFVWDPCHNHWHYRGYAEYVLFNADGVRIPVGSKNGFCVLDLECDNGGNGKYNCGNMGISAGCGDIYDASLPCQWIDITELAAGNYTLAVRVNWDQSPDKTGRPESDYVNNWAQTCFTLSYDNSGTPELETVNNCPPFTDCLGVPFGSAQPDCTGQCGGSALQGDWNADLARASDDVTGYLDAALAADGVPTDCNDLFDNDTIDVYDAALLQECVLHTDDPQYWGVRFPCQFPGGSENPADIVYLLPGTLDTAARTFDVEIVNPYNKLLGFEFSLGDLVIDSVENLQPAFEADWRFNAASGKLLALSANEKPLGKNILPTAFVRVHYSSLTNTEICLKNITAVVNERYERSNAQVADPACVNTGLVSSGEPAGANLQVYALPNPAQDQVTLFMGNTETWASYTVRLTDALGRLHRLYENVRSESVIVPRGDLPAGLYYFSVENGRSGAVGKVVFR